MHRYVRPVIAFVTFASGVKYVGLNTTALGWTLCVTLFLSAGTWLALARPWRVQDQPLHGERDGEPELVGVG